MNQTSKALIFCMGILMAATAFATPANTAILDGKPIEYDATDLRGTFTGAPAWGSDGTLTNLFVTWDADYVYVALQGWHANSKKLVVLIDVDPGAGTGATSTTNWSSMTPDFIQWNAYGWVDGGAFGLDYLAASEGTYNNLIRINYDGVAIPSTNNLDSLFDQGNSSTPAGTPIDMAGLNDFTTCLQKGFEVRIPWTNLYEGTRFGTVEPGETVPRNASLRLLAGIHTNSSSSSYSSPDTIPNQAVEDYTNGIVTTATYLDVPIDADTNGIPDMLGGDVNAPYLRAASSAVGASTVYAAFNEPVTPSTVQSLANWDIDGAAPTSAVAQGTQGVLLGLTAPIPDTSPIAIRASGVEDTSANSRDVSFCLFPSDSGIPQEVAVTFQVNTNSGMGISSDHDRPTGFFVNGSALPLEWGTPAVQTTPLTPIPGSNGWTSATVVFPAGSPTELDYKYTGVISGTNNYEAITLTDFGETSRPLTLNTNGTPVTVVDYLGAAAYPLRTPGDTNPPTAQNRLYADARRGDAGVRVRREILFQLDLSLRDRDKLSRVMVLGSDPLRGFNDTGSGQESASDYPDNSAFLDWNIAGIELVDDGTLGDVTPGDGIYSRLWAFSTNGLDSAVEPGDPYSLVGGDDFTEPYLGYGWTARRSPRSMLYKFFVLTTGGSSYDSPDYNLDYYITDPDATAQIVLDPWVWDDDAIPPPPPSNAPVVVAVVTNGATATIDFENVLGEAAHGVKIADNLLDGFNDYGTRAVMGGTNGGVRQWSATILEVSPVKEYYAPYAGLEPEEIPDYWSPSFIPATATTVRIYFNQINNNLQGRRNLAVTGPFAGWGDGLPMTFIGDGNWMADVALDAGTEDILEYKARNATTWLDGDNLKAIRGGAGATWIPDQPVTNEPFSLTFDAAGTTLETATNVQAHLGVPGGAWLDYPMTNTAGTVWEQTLLTPSNATVSIDWVFNGYLAGETNLTWYSPGIDWKAFLDSFVNP